MDPCLRAERLKPFACPEGIGSFRMPAASQRLASIRTYIAFCSLHPSGNPPTIAPKLKSPNPKLGFLLEQDNDLGGGKRWVVVRPRGGGTGLLFAEPKNDGEAACIGNQTGGRVFLFLTTDHFERDYQRMTRAGVTFREPPRREVYETVAVFEDLYGNLFDLIEPVGPGK
jgi:hypothetical protein